MTNPILADLCEGQILQANPLATVTREWVVVPSPAAQSHTVIALSRLSGWKRIRTSYPVFLVVSAALSLIAAAAFCSKQGIGTGLPIALLAACFVAGYVVSRKTAIAFVVGNETTETVAGTSRQAAELIKAVQAALGSLHDDESCPFE